LSFVDGYSVGQIVHNYLDPEAAQRGIGAVSILIDGHNLIGRLPTLSLEDPDDEEKLVRLLKSYRARTGKAISVVFDPGSTFALPGAHREGGIEIVFAPYGTTADAVIARRVEKSRTPAGLLVVTSDQEVADRVTRWGARVESSDAFAAELIDVHESLSKSKDPSLSPEEVEAWLALFENREGRDDQEKGD
jgi:predicted RNA-binding protein with PIN domain